MKYKPHDFTTLLEKTQASNAQRKTEQSSSPIVLILVWGLVRRIPSSPRQPAGWVRDQRPNFRKRMKRYSCFSPFEFKKQSHQSAYPLLMAQNGRRVNCHRASDCFAPDFQIQRETVQHTKATEAVQPLT